MDDLIKDFLQESHENLDRLDQDFVKLESDPGNPDLLKSIFRTIHTIKGTCGFLGFAKLEALTHAGESLLSLLRDGEMELTEECADILLEMVDAVRAYLQEIQTTEAEGNADTSELIARLKELQGSKSAGGKLSAGAPAVGSREPSPAAEEKKPAVASDTPKSEAPAPVKKEAVNAPENGAGTAKPRDEESKPKKGKQEVAREGSREESKDATIRVDVNLLKSR